MALNSRRLHELPGQLQKILRQFANGVVFAAVEGFHEQTLSSLRLQRASISSISYQYYLALMSL